MPQDISVFDPYRAEVLFLLVGGNPLPNYVAAQLMVEEQGEIHLLATSGTKDVAERLKCKLEQAMSQVKITYHLMPEVGGFEIEQVLAEILRQVKTDNRRVGLNYTGGTKDMAVHVYDRLQDAFGKRGAVFSYLDAGTRKMSICVEGNPTQWPSAARAITPSLQNLWELHGLQIKGSRKGPFVQRTQPRLPELCRAIAQVHSSSKGFQQWRDWLKTLGRPNGAPPSFDQYPDLEDFINEIERACGGPPDAKSLAALIGGEDCETLSKCTKFFVSEWLEEYALDALLACQKEIGFQDWAISLNLQPPPPDDPKERQAPDFELDVVALAGYQLFLLSCIATEAGEPEADEDEAFSVPEPTQPPKKKGAGKRSEAKKHLFEAYTRARQVGGDEARAILISCIADPDLLQTEVEQKWDAKNKIKVFGQSHLRDLPNELARWFRAQQ